MKKSLVNQLFVWVLTFGSFLTACSVSEVEMNYPQGPQGEQGANGLSAYDIWKGEVEAGRIQWPADKVAVTDFFAYIKGTPGADGKDGISAYELWKTYIATGNIQNPHDLTQLWPNHRNSEADFWDFLTGRDGMSPHIGNNGNWFIGTRDLNIPAQGARGLNGEEGKSAYELWKNAVENGTVNWDKNETDMNDFFRFLKGEPGLQGLQGIPGANGAKGADGKDAILPHIGTDGNWWIGTTNLGVKAQGIQGASGVNGNNGNNGTDGKSAYELWKEDLAARCGTNNPVKNNQTGANWDCAANSLTDFYRFLTGTKGADGINGKDGTNGTDGINGKDGTNGKDGDKGADGESAYSLWKTMAQTGLLKDPTNPALTWPDTEVSEADFFRFLTGRDGKDGKDGLSAYEFWKEELAARCGTATAFINRHTNAEWPCEENSVDDFWEFLTGVEGKAGADGRPGKPGKPGADAIPIPGMFNVLAQYSKSEFSEYVRATDGGVLYKIFTPYGGIAANAVVTGLPGIPNKSYTADSQGEFVVPKEDLPSIQSLDARFGSTASVTYNGETAASAPNTYVPNQVQTRLIMPLTSVGMDTNIYTKFQVERRLNPDDPWEIVPDYITPITTTFKAYLIPSHNNRQSISESNLLFSATPASATTDFKKDIPFSIPRPVMRNPYNKNTVPQLKLFYDPNLPNLTVVTSVSYYGKALHWDGSLKIAPYQIEPLIKNVVATGLRKSGQYEYFDKITMELDYSNFDLNQLYSGVYTREDQPDGSVVLQSIPLPIEDAKKFPMAFARSTLGTTSGNQISTSESIRATQAAPLMTLYTSYVGSEIEVHRRATRNFLNLGTLYTLVKDPATSQYSLEKNPLYPALPDLTITVNP